MSYWITLCPSLTLSIIHHSATEIEGQKPAHIYMYVISAGAQMVLVWISQSRSTSQYIGNCNGEILSGK